MVLAEFHGRVTRDNPTGLPLCRPGSRWSWRLFAVELRHQNGHLGVAALLAEIEDRSGHRFTDRIGAALRVGKEGAQ
jgi:hypothetical protein